LSPVSTGGFKQEVVLSSFKGDGAPVSGRLQLAPVASQDECHDTGIAVATAELSAETDQAFPLGSLNTLSDGDPSAFTTFSLVGAVQPTEGFDCYLRIVAYAPLDWTAGEISVVCAERDGTVRQL